jgi:sodium/hydrogen exchanger 8
MNNSVSSLAREVYSSIIHRRLASSSPQQDASSALPPRHLLTINTNSSSSSSPLPTNATISFEQAEELHEYDALTTLLLNITITTCLLLAYYVKKFRIYYLPESAGALLVGMFVGGMARLFTDNDTNDRLQLFEFSPEVFFFVLLPPIIFEAGYSLKRKDFFENIGAITLYAMFGTIISTLVVGGLCFAAAWLGWVDLDASNPMEELLFGALISAVDPVATLSILGSAELNCDPLLYSLVFGESVLNDAIAISLFNVFAGYYIPDGPDFSLSQIPHALMTFVLVSAGSVTVGVLMGLLASFMYKNTSISDFPNLETSLLFSFCYLGYSTAEAISLSGIMALFFQGVTLSHYNSYNLSSSAHVASEQIFATLATIAEST